MILGITGGTGSGKTTLLEAARELGFLVLDCDRIYHRLLETDPRLLSAIEEAFPGTVEAGTLQRKKLGAIVFGDPRALETLNAITHGVVRREVERQLTGEKNIAIDAVALFESGLCGLCDVTVAVTAPKEQRILRLMERDGISREYAQSRMDAQPSDQWFAQHCDHLLENTSDRSQFYGKCLAFLRQLGIMKENSQEE